MQSRAVVDGTEENPNARVRCAVWCEERKGKAGREERGPALSAFASPQPQGHSRIRIARTSLRVVAWWLHKKENQA